jgi:hypothetical protein
MKKLMGIGLLLLGAAAVSGCTGVKAYQKEHLAQREMAITPDPLDSAYEDHIYFSLEASSGGRSFGGGGCGCN